MTDQPDTAKKKKTYCPWCGDPKDSDKKFCSELCRLNNMVSAEPWRVIDD